MGACLLTVDELRAIERVAQRDLPPGTLMARAGQAAARRIDGMAGARGASVCVVAGPGNNGGDGFVVAQELAARGHAVSCVLIGAAAPQAPDARQAFERWRAGGGAVASTLPDRDFDVGVDALFGIGLARPLQGAWLDAVGWMATHARHVVALDVPSGLDADRGGWVGDVEGVRAEATITFLADKPGLRTGAGVDAAGVVHVEPIGIEVRDAALRLVGPDTFVQVTRPRRRNTHKGSFGNVLVVGGGAGMVGAPLLAARAALRLGAGRVFVDCLGAPELRVDPVQPELMFRPHATVADSECIVVGCGLGVDDTARSALAWCLARPAALVVDADGLNLLATDAALRSALAARAAPTVLTPHPLEAARLAGGSARAVQADRIGAARRLAHALHSIVVLKGAGTVIAAPDGGTAVNPTGTPALATAGTGDVLAGMLGALLAQGFDPWQAVTAAVWLHGASAHDAGDVGLVAGEVALRAAEVLRGLRQGG